MKHLKSLSFLVAIVLSSALCAESRRYRVLPEEGKA